MEEDNERREFQELQNNADDFLQTLKEFADKASELSEAWNYENFNADEYFDLSGVDLPFNQSFDDVALSLRNMQHNLEIQRGAKWH